MLILSIIKYAAGVTSCIFSLVCFAQGLFYIADVVEEHGQAAKKILRVIVYSDIVLHVLMLFDEDISTFQAFIGLCAHLLYLALLPQFPFVNIRSPIAIASAIAAILNHFSWFFHVLLSETYLYTYFEIAGIFVICVWLCPLSFVVSLSSTEPLPMSSAPVSSEDSDDALASGAMKRKGHSLFAMFFNFVKAKSGTLLPTRSAPTSATAHPTAPPDAEPSLVSSMELQQTEGIRRTVTPTTDYSAKFL